MAKNKRTTAQRRAAAKEAWKLRRLKAANAPTPVKRTADLLPIVSMPDESNGKFKAVFSNHINAAAPISAAAPMTAVATREGDDLFVTVSGNGSLHRHRVSEATLRKLALDALALVG